MHIFSPSVESFLLAYCLACIAFGLSVFIFKSDLPNACSSVNISDHTKRINTQILSATVIVFLGALVFRQGQILILENNNLLAEAGFFNIAFILATSAVTLIPGIYQEVLLPKIAKATKNHDFNRSLDQAQRYLLILCLYGAISRDNVCRCHYRHIIWSKISKCGVCSTNDGYI